VNEPAAFGANTALQAAGTAENVIVVSVDGGCEGVRGVQDGQNLRDFTTIPSQDGLDGHRRHCGLCCDWQQGFRLHRHGVTLIADKAVEGVASENTEYGLANCWGE
jgi:fructose transport system substrate-binding protein